MTPKTACALIGLGALRHTVGSVGHDYIRACLDDHALDEPSRRRREFTMTIYNCLAATATTTSRRHFNAYSKRLRGRSRRTCRLHWRRLLARAGTIECWRFDDALHNYLRYLNSAS
jgi:hypothetical protein